MDVMGSLSLVAYFDVNQADIQKYINENNLNTSSWDDAQEIARYFKTKYLTACSYPFHVHYLYNRRIDKHEFFDAHPVAFILQDIRLQSPIRRGCCKIKRNIHVACIRTVKDAIVTAHDLRMEYDNDDSLMLFAGWLQVTARFCLQYRIENY